MKRAIHYNDNRGGGDEHIAPFLGTLNHDEVITALIDVGFKGYFTLECDSMLKNGLIDEVKALQAEGLTRNHISMQGLGYKEILAYLEGEITLEEAIYILKRDTRHFAKRQITWFKREKEVKWLDKSKFVHNDDAVFEEMMKHLKNKDII